MLAWVLVALSMATSDPTPDVYILAGQSNMSGRGAITALTADELRADPAIRLFGNDGQERLALDPLDSAAGQIDLVSEDKQAAVGPGLFFARAMRAAGGKPILLVPCAKGGSSIGRWQPGGGRNTLYGSCLARARQAGGRIAGILWYQGESDTDTAARAERWSASFTALVDAWRKDLGQPRLPIVFVQLADIAARPDRAAKAPGWETLQAVQAKIALSCVAMVSAKGLKLNDDELHLATEAQRTLGGRLADAMRGLRAGKCR